MECANIVSGLLSSVCLVRDKDAASKQKYNMLTRPEVREFAETILYFCRRELVIREQLHVAFVRNIADADKEFLKDETFLLLRLFQEDRMAKTSVSEFTRVSFADVYDVLTREDGRKMTEKALRDMISRFQKMNLVNYDAKEEMITIYPSIYCVLEEGTLEEAAEYIDALKAGKGGKTDVA